MSRVVGIGGAPLDGYALAGVEVIEAGDEAAVREAWAGLDGEVGLVLLTPRAHAVLGPALADAELPWAVLPD